MADNANEISTLTTAIEDQKLIHGIPSFTQSELDSLLNTGISEGEDLANKIYSLREVFSLDSNPVTNQVGYTGASATFSLMNLLLPSQIVNESKVLFALNAVQQGEIISYRV